MKIAGREIGLKRNVLANCKLTEIAPDRNLTTFFTERVASPDYAVAQMAAAQFIAALNEGYEQSRHFEDPAYIPNPVSASDLLTLREEYFNSLYAEAMKVYNDDGKTTVEVAPPKGKKTAKRGASN